MKSAVTLDKNNPWKYDQYFIAASEVPAHVRNSAFSLMLRALRKAGYRAETPSQTNYNIMVYQGKEIVARIDLLDHDRSNAFIFRYRSYLGTKALQPISDVLTASPVPETFESWDMKH